MRLLMYKGVMSRLNTVVMEEKLIGGVFESELINLGIPYYKEISLMGFKSGVLKMKEGGRCKLKY